MQMRNISNEFSVRSSETNALSETHERLHAGHIIVWIGFLPQQQNSFGGLVTACLNLNSNRKLQRAQKRVDTCNNPLVMTQHVPVV